MLELPMVVQKESSMAGWKAGKWVCLTAVTWAVLKVGSMVADLVDK